MHPVPARGQERRRQPLPFTRHTQEARWTHQHHQHEHFRLSHPTPVAIPRSHDAVATSGYAGAIGFPQSLGSGARLLGKCGSGDEAGGRYCTCRLRPSSEQLDKQFFPCYYRALVSLRCYSLVYTTFFFLSAQCSHIGRHLITWGG